MARNLSGPGVPDKWQRCPTVGRVSPTDHPPAPPTGVRRHNLAAVLRLVHLHGALSRARLTALTGLNRSTVAALVRRLVEAGLVTESSSPGSGRVGRPSPVVGVDPCPVVIAVNPEVDGLDLAAVDLAQRLPARERIPFTAPPSAAEVAELVAARISQWSAGTLAGHRVIGLGAAVPGLVRRRDGVVRDAPHLGWRDAPFGAMLAAATGLPTSVGNDASMGAVAEHLFGAGRGRSHLIYLNGGASGIGGGLVVDGRLVDGAGGYAGELGQARVPASADVTIPAPSARTTGDQISAGDFGVGRGPTVEAEVNRARLLAALACDYTGDDDLAEAIGRADPTARVEVDRQRAVLADAIATAVHLLNPELVLLGGFLAALAADLPELHEAVRARTMTPCGEDLEIRVAGLTDTVLLIGAAEAAWSATLANPLAALPG